jgi:hypothetical protein
MQARKSFSFGVVITLLAISVPHLLFADEEERRNRQRERHRNGDHRAGDVKPVTNPVYKENCGACHFSYQPELLPSGSWRKILNQLGDHFGESLELDQEVHKAVLAYLEANAAERSTSKRAVRIMRSMGDSTPVRITEIPYIKGKHREITAGVLDKPSIGSLSNCAACHRRAEEGNYDDDFVIIPE